MKLSLLLALLGALLPIRVFGSCELVDIAVAERVLGPDIVDTTTDPNSFCLFISSKTAAQFSVRTDTRALYDQVSIPQPFTLVDIGEAGRYHEYPKGGVAIQFAKGDTSLTIAVRILRDDGRDYLTLLLDIAREIAVKLK